MGETVRLYRIQTEQLPRAGFRLLGRRIDPNLWLTLVIVVAIILVGIGAVLTRRDLTLRTTSGYKYSLRLRDRKTVEEFLSKRGEEITRKWQK